MNPGVFPLYGAKRGMNKRDKIIELNDRLRTTFKGGRVELTPAVYNLDPHLRGRAIWAMARYNRFDDSSEHDWGVFIFAGYAFEWRIEYCGSNGTGLSPDPADPEKTFRVLYPLYRRGSARRDVRGEISLHEIWKEPVEMCGYSSIYERYDLRATTVPA